MVLFIVSRNWQKCENHIPRGEDSINANLSNAVMHAMGKTMLLVLSSQMLCFVGIFCLINFCASCQKFRLRSFPPIPFHSILCRLIHYHIFF